MSDNQNKLNFPAGANLAPVQQFVDLKDPQKADKISDHYLIKQIKEKYGEKMAESRTTRNSLIQIGEINDLFLRGEQAIELNYFTKRPQIVPADKRDKDHVKIINKMQSFSTETIDKWRTSKSDSVAAPFSNNDEAEAQARKANTVVDYLELDFFTERFVQQESLAGQIWGWYGRRVRPDYASKSLFQFREIIEDRQTPIGKGYGRCRECGYKGEKSNQVKEKDSIANLCPDCGKGSGIFEYDAPVNILMPKTVGREKVFLPKIGCASLPFPSTVWDYSKSLPESDWCVSERKIKENALRRILSNIRFPEGESGNEFGLDAIETLARRGAALAGLKARADDKDDSKEIVLTEMHLGEDDLYDIKIGGDEKTVEGMRLPKGKRMSDIYTDAVFIGINGMSLLIGIYGENHREIDSDGVFHMKSLAGTGRGIEDTVPIQDLFNKGFSQVNNFMNSRGFPPILTAENAIEPRYKKLLAKPSAVIPIKIQNFPDFKSLDQLIRPMQGESVPGDILQTLFSNYEDLLQRAFQITNFSGGNPHVDNHTLGGAQLLEANGDSLQSPRLAIKAECDLNTVKNGFYKWCAANPLPRFVPFKAQGRTGYGMEISGKEVDAEYRWSYIEGSEAPKNRETELRKKGQFFSMFGGAGGYFTAKAQDPKGVAELEKDFDVNFAIDSNDNLGENCRLRFERAKKQMRGGEPDYLMILGNLEPSLEITEANLKDKAVWFQALFDTPEGNEMDRKTRSLVGAFVEAFHKLDEGQTIEIQQSQARIQIEAQKPIQEAQEAQEAKQMAAQGQMERQKALTAQSQQSEQSAGAVLQTLNANDQAEQQRNHVENTQNQQHAMELLKMQQQDEENDAQRAHEQILAAQNNQEKQQ